MKNFGLRLKQIRELREMDIDDVADRLKISRKSMMKLENGERRIRLQEFTGLCHLYHFSADLILMTSDEEWEDRLLIEKYRLLSKEQQDILLEKLKEF